MRPVGPPINLVAAIVACAPHSSSPTAADATDASTTSGEVATTTDDATTTEETSTTGEPSCTPGSGEPGGTLLWSRSGPDLSFPPRFAEMNAAGELVLVGFDGSDVLLEVRDAAWNLRWSDVYAGVNGLEDRPLALAVDAEGFVHVLLSETIRMVHKETFPEVDARLVLLRYAPDGGHVWRWEQTPPPPTGFLNEVIPAGMVAVEGDEVRVIDHSCCGPTTSLRLDRFGNLVETIVLDAVRAGRASCSRFTRIIVVMRLVFALRRGASSA